MKNHLDELEISAAAAGLDLEDGAKDHLQACVSCRRLVTEFQDAIQARRAQMMRREPDWEAQKEAVLEQLPQIGTVTRRWHTAWARPLLAAAATIFLAIGVGVLYPRPGSLPSPTPNPNLPIEQILAEAESLLADDGLLDFQVFDNITDDDLNALFSGQAS